MNNLFRPTGTEKQNFYSLHNNEPWLEEDVREVLSDEGLDLVLVPLVDAGLPLHVVDQQLGRVLQHRLILEI